MLKRKSGINLEDSDGDTALSLAKKFGNNEIVKILEDSQGLGKVQNFGGASTNRPRAASTLSPGKASTLGPRAASALSPGGASALGQCTSYLNLRRASAPSGPPNSKDPDVQRPDLSSGTVETSINPQVADLRKKFGNTTFKSNFHS